ncbi:uncharacterized protein CANTADRAFT_25111 [Suhomyces tanzawaensis NRRL Y-17324]|uniref:Uncharacterized protein n=1 Tax=Suhomyces tanzawaensis NRRL Y-17324 TaxID=984487 RepID=A0A1E4SMM8_9ASCO|nr:uncharacterized protein CANTADRAFT_25111 [Suhomyces tanzawaensis NRRL Y-17324]ODV80667.1 hypothetical protein CANTADRAFT_25111 [Suhomyces tanzawaensis NRRL Y-17324]
MHEIERYEEEDTEEDDTRLMEAGIELGRYADFGDGTSTHYDRIYTTLSYSSLQERNLDLLTANYHDIASLHQHHLAQHERLRDEYSSAARHKRAQVDDTNLRRKKRQLGDFKPADDYLAERWKDGIKSVVELGIEAARLDMEMS